MRLINTETLQLQEFYGTIPIYAILSHTWGDEEPSLEDFRDPAGSSAGHKKIHAACRQACADGLEYLWVDTCCIMKSSSAELSEAINSMFRWYKEAKVCYVYLVDFECQQGPPIDPFGPESDISKCRWFTRGWTLQELIAPRDVRFYDKAWRFIGRKSDSMIKISNITGIDPVVLADSSRDNLDNCPVARRMSWAARRQTTRPEDMAYCLMGLFDVNMPMLYGEGEKAFLRLQEEVIKRSNDLSMFAWKDSAEDHEPTGRYYIEMFAKSPRQFSHCCKVKKYGEFLSQISTLNSTVQFTLSNRGLSFTGTQLHTFAGRPGQTEPCFALSLGCVEQMTEATNPGKTEDVPMYIALKMVAKGLFARTNMSCQGLADESEYFHEQWMAYKDITVMAKPQHSLWYGMDRHLHRSLHITMHSDGDRVEERSAIRNLGPPESWDLANSRFVMNGASGFVAYMRIEPDTSNTGDNTFVAIFETRHLAEPLIRLMPAAIWTIYESEGKTIKFIASQATSYQMAMNDLDTPNRLELPNYIVTTEVEWKPFRGRAEGYAYHHIAIHWDRKG